MQFLDRLSPHAHWLLRIALAATYLYHGIGKFGDTAGFSAFTGLPVPVTLAAGAVEVAAALLVLAGGRGPEWLTRLGAALMVPVIVGAIATVHWPRWSFVCTETHPWGGMEFQLTLLWVMLYLLIQGNAANRGRGAGA